MYKNGKKKFRNKGNFNEFRMNNEVSQKLRLAVKSKLTTLDAYIDDELPDLILVMLARKKDRDF